MPSKAELKKLRSLHYKKYRQQHGLFMAEGPSLVEALLASKHPLDQLYATPEGYERLQTAVPQAQVEMVAPDTLAAISALDTPQGVLATVPLPSLQLEPEAVGQQWLLAIDGLQNPGNLGTIIRTADWFGFPDIVCSPNTVDAYNPKVVQASMGSIFHTRLVYRYLPTIAAKANTAVYTLAKGGVSLYEATLPTAGLLVIGHETQGISQAMQAEATEVLSIPGFGQAESLNAAVATAVTIAHLRASLQQQA